MLGGGTGVEGYGIFREQNVRTQTINRGLECRSLSKGKAIRKVEIKRQLKWKVARAGIANGWKVVLI